MDKKKRDAMQILKYAIEASSPYFAIRNQVTFKAEKLSVIGRSFPASRIHVVGAGKASAFMARATEEICGESIVSGIVNTKYGYGCRTRRIRINECGHPAPDRNSLAGTEQIVRFMKERGKGDLVIALISGGGSSLLAKPEEGITLHDKAKTGNLLFRCGASIGEINCVRKHLSAVKGGKLADMTRAKVVCLLMSDVVGDNPSVIASGPFASDDTTFSDALNVLEKYNLLGKVPSSVLNCIKEGTKGKRTETLKKTNADHFIIANNYSAIKAAQRKAEALGYNTLLLSSLIEGESRLAAGFHVQIARQILATDEPVSKPACIISGGETTVKVKGKGRGGPNCEFVLSAAMEIRGKPITVAAIDTDGQDFTDAAGAIADGKTVTDVEEAKKFLENNDSYNYFKNKKGLIFTGPTGTNLNDLRVLIVGKAQT